MGKQPFFNEIFYKYLKFKKLVKWSFFKITEVLICIFYWSITNSSITVIFLFKKNDDLFNKDLKTIF